MTQPVCLTVDVEDWYDGMAVLGQHLEVPRRPTSGLDGLAEILDGAGTAATVTLFVVGDYAPRVRDEISRLAAAGHEIASHGPDHGRLPEEPARLVEWLRAGRLGLEDLVQAPVGGFRSPRFDRPASLSLGRYREALAEAGFAYVSDTHELGAASPVRELPVLRRSRIPIGGGSYQRLLPGTLVRRTVETTRAPSVLYYHSYDFGASLPPLRSVRSLAVAKQLLLRDRVASIFTQLVNRYGSRTCADAAHTRH